MPPTVPGEWYVCCIKTRPIDPPIFIITSSSFCLDYFCDPFFIKKVLEPPPVPVPKRSDISFIIIYFWKRRAVDYDSAWILHSANIHKWRHTFTRHSLQRKTVCFNGDINFHFFPPFRTFWWNLDVYMLDDICKYMWGWFYDIWSFYCGSVASEAPRIRAQ